MKFIKSYIKRFSFLELVELLIEVFNIISELAMGLISLISAMLIVILYPFIIIGEVLDRMDNKQKEE